LSERLHSSSDQALILVKALPHRSSNYFETVCCAGIGRDQKWRRQYPVPFRILQDSQKFKRWSWIEYDFTSPKDDQRSESQKVVPESIQVVGTLKTNERAKFLAPLIRESTKEAEARNETLTLIRPDSLNLSWNRKTTSEIEDERRKHAALANQWSLFDQSAKPLTPCPYKFSFQWRSRLGTSHQHTCDDWETSTAFANRLRSLGSESSALTSLKTTYEEDYLSKGIAFALGTHSRWERTWLLVGILRLDERDTDQIELF